MVNQCKSSILNTNSIHLSTCPPVHLSTCPPVHLSTCPHPPSCLLGRLGSSTSAALVLGRLPGKYIYLADRSPLDDTKRPKMVQPWHSWWAFMSLDFQRVQLLIRLHYFKPFLSIMTALMLPLLVLFTVCNLGWGLKWMLNRWKKLYLAATLSPDAIQGIGKISHHWAAWTFRFATWEVQPATRSLAGSPRWCGDHVSSGDWHPENPYVYLLWSKWNNEHPFQPAK